MEDIMRINIPMRSDEYRFMCINKNTNHDKIVKVYSKTFKGALKQANGRFDPKDWTYESCLFPDKKLYGINPDGSLKE